MANLDKDYYLDEQGLQTLINELETNLMALEYSTSATYAVGDYCVHDNKMYRCTTAISTAEAWNSTHWASVIIGDELKTKKSGTVTSVTIKGTSPIVSSSESAITTSGTRTISHANSGVTAGDYTKVTVNATGHVTAGDNPTTLSGYGITDAKIESGTITLGSNSIQIPTITDTYSGTSSDGMSGKAVKSAIDALDGGTIGTPSASKTLTALSQTNGNINATFADIAIANTQVSGLGTASTKDVPTSGNASSTQVVMGNDTRLTDSRTPTSHSHGNIANGGTIASTAVTPASNDYILISDNSSSGTANKIERGIKIGTSTTTFLNESGKWSTPVGTTYADGTGITIGSGNAINHSNSVTAQTTQKVYPIKIDAQGHISAYGTSPTTLSGYGITDAKIASGVITLGSNTITPLTASSTLDATKLSGTIPSGCYTDTKNTAGSTDTSSKIFLIGATSQATNPQTYSDDQCYVTSGALQVNTLKSTAGVYSNTASSASAGGLSLWGTTAPETYGIAMRQTGTTSGQLGKHGYVQGDFGMYLSMSAGSSGTRGWIFRSGSYNYASIDVIGNAVFNGSVTIGGNATNDSGCRLTYNSTTQSCDFVFA